MQSYPCVTHKGKGANRFLANPLYFTGTPGWIRTSDIQIRSLALYPAELRAHDVKKWRRERDLNPRYTFTAYNRLAGDRFRPLSHLSAIEILLAEGAGFEPARLSPNGFQDRRHRPLGHPSSVFHRTCGRQLPYCWNPVNPFHVRT
jgi:hypothetical protein